MHLVCKLWIRHDLSSGNSTWNHSPSMQAEQAQPVHLHNLSTSSLPKVCISPSSMYSVFSGCNHTMSSRGTAVLTGEAALPHWLYLYVICFGWRCSGKSAPGLVQGPVSHQPLCNASDHTQGTDHFSTVIFDGQMLNSL